jgi:hypothetical protein
MQSGMLLPSINMRARMQVAFTCQWTGKYFKVGEIYEVWWDTLRGQPQRVPFDTTTLHKHQTNAKNFCPVVRHADLTDASKTSAARGTQSLLPYTVHAPVSVSMIPCFNGTKVQIPTGMVLAF